MNLPIAMAQTIPDQFFHTIGIWIPQDLMTENATFNANGAPIAHRK
jgi:hypothetical protein